NDLHRLTTPIHEISGLAGYFMNPPKADRETGNPLVVDAACRRCRLRCGAGLSGAQRARII
ncbi:MAG: hypothetical protein V3R70_05875, partial [Syntrophobacteria bacterium]